MDSRATALSRAAPEAVWARLIDGRRWFDWNPSVRWMVVEGPLAPGSYMTVQPARGRQTAFVLDAVDPAARLAFSLRVGPLARLDFDYRIERAPEGSQIALELRTSGPLRRWLAGRARRIAAAMPAAVESLAQLAAA